MNIAGTEYSIQTKSFDIFVSGCTRQCPGCFNPEAWDFNYGEEVFTRRYDGTTPIDDIINKINESSSIIDNIRIMGGDLLEQKIFDAVMLIKYIKNSFPDKQLILYTGAEKEEIPNWCFELFDAIKYGRYIQELHCDNPLFGSSNQKYIVRGVDY